MEIIAADGTPTTYLLVGKFTSRDKAAFDRVIEDVRAGSGRTVLLDLAELEDIDAFGIQLLLSALDDAERRGNRLRIRNPRDAVRRALSTANLASLLYGGEETDALSAKPGAVREKPAARAILQVARREGTDAWVVELSGRFTFADHKIFEEVIREVSQNPRQTLVLDLAKLDFMDSAGLSMLLIARDEAAKGGTTTILQSPTGRVANLLRMAAVDTIVDVRDGA